MRQLKFRICYTDQKDDKYIFYDSKRFMIGLDGSILEDYGKPWGAEESDWQVPFDVWTHPFIQQFTGMKDCNGVDIYEGDLVNFKVKTHAEILTFENQEVKYLDDYAMFVFGDDEYCLNDYIVRDSIIVVGNIYEQSTKL